MAERDGDQPVWTPSLVQDVTTNVLGSLLSAQVLRPELRVGALRDAVQQALAAANIQAGEIR